MSEVRSLLGLASYCSRFIPDFATCVQPLRELTKKNVKWRWTQVEEKALNELKSRIAKTSLRYFDTALRTELSVDASPVGLAVVMAQYDPRQPDQKHVVLNASRTLSNVEQRYSQVEKEALAVVWACERLHLYVYASEFDIVTDNKAVELIFGNPNSKPKARIERWALRMMPYKFNVIHRPGRDNIADYLSRNPMPAIEREHEVMAEAYVNFVSSVAIPAAINKAKLVAATSSDQAMGELIKMLKGQAHKLDTEYERVRGELTLTSDGLVMRGNRVVVPVAMRRQVVQIAHGGHMGVVKTKQLVRAYVWFPGIDEAVEKEIKQCHQCQINRDQTTHTPSQMSTMPLEPWQELSIDFYGPLGSGKYLLVIIDDHSRYPLAIMVSSTAATTVIPKLNEVFATFGVPRQVRSDNGPPFNSYKFAEFAREQGFSHRKITPLWPQANGICERFMRNLGKVMRSSSGVNLEQDLTEFMRNYRATPHSSTGVAPSSLLFRSSSSTFRMPNYQQQKAIDGITKTALDRDASAKATMKLHNDENRHARLSILQIGDTVLLKQTRSHKAMPLFDPKPFKITALKHTMATIERVDPDTSRIQRLVRDVSLMQKYQSSLEAEKREKQNTRNANTQVTW